MRPDSDDPLCGPFWKAAADHRLVMTWCDACDTAVWYPHPACPHCHGALVWRPLSGRATLLSWTVVRKPVNPDFKVPYIPALVLPIEAPNARLVTQLVDCEPSELICDMPVSVRFRELETRGGDRYMAPLFGPLQ